MIRQRGPGILNSWVANKLSCSRAGLIDIPKLARCLDIPEQHSKVRSGLGVAMEWSA